MNLKCDDGCRGSFRRPRSSGMITNVFLGVALGIGTGNYIFKDFLEEHWNEENALRQEQKTNSASKE